MHVSRFFLLECLIIWLNILQVLNLDLFMLMDYKSLTYM